MTDRDATSPPKPDWPFKPGPAKVRVWEILLFQILLALMCGPLFVGLVNAYWRSGPAPGRRDRTIALVHALCVPMLAFVFADKTLESGARFARSGRVSITASALASGCFLFYTYQELGFYSLLPASDFAILPAFFGIFPGITVAVFCWILNVLDSHKARPVLCWAPLFLAVVQMVALYSPFILA